MDNFKSLCHLPQYCRWHIYKNSQASHIWRCISFLRGLSSNLCPRVCGCRGTFTNVNAGRLGSVGDEFTFNRSQLRQRLADGRWGNAAAKAVLGQQVSPYLVGDLAFLLTQKLMKCYDGVNLTAWQRCFNYHVIRTRHVVEMVFGCMKGRWRVLVDNFPRDHEFATDMSLVCCALHNVCERANYPVRRQLDSCRCCSC